MFLTGLGAVLPLCKLTGFFNCDQFFEFYFYYRDW